MSLKRNLLANYAGQAYTAVIGIVMLPVYVRYMGAEAYGLVGFSAMLQAWLQILELGLTPTLSREISRFKAGNLDGRQVASMLRSTEWFLGAVGVVIALLFPITSGWIAQHWLNARSLDAGELRGCVICMGGIIASRGLVGLYRGGLSGMEYMGALNLAGSLLVTLRSVGVLLVMVFWSSRPIGFFAYQLVVSLLELVVMRTLFYRRFPMGFAAIRPDFRSMRTLLGMAASMTFLAGLWTIISQSDRLILSWTLDLSAYGFFTVAVTLAGGLNLLVAPMGQVLQPRFTILMSQGAQARLVELYRTFTQFTAAGAFAIAGVMGILAERLLHAWTGNGGISEHAAEVLALYALGNAVAALLALAFAIQFAHGKLRLHVLGNCAFALVWIPGIYWASQQAGAVGVGWVWLGGNLAYLVGWLPWVHRRIMTGLWWRWLVFDIATVLLAEAVVLAALSRIDISGLGRWGVFATCILAAVVVLFAGLLAGVRTRVILRDAIRSLLAAKFAR